MRLTTSNQTQQDLEAKNIKDNTLADADYNQGGQIKTQQARGQDNGQPSQVWRLMRAICNTGLVFFPVENMLFLSLLILLTCFPVVHVPYNTHGDLFKKVKQNFCIG